MYSLLDSDQMYKDLLVVIAMRKGRECMCTHVACKGRCLATDTARCTDIVKQFVLLGVFNRVFGWKNAIEQ